MQKTLIGIFFLSYLLNVGDVHQFDDFVLLGRPRPGARALKAKVAGGQNRCFSLRHDSTLNNEEDQKGVSS